MKKIKAIIVDDEESARDVLENLLLRFCPEVTLVAKCSHVEEAVQTIKNTQPHLVFLDIEMPNYAGYEITEFFDELPFDIIFVTAYNQYALRAFEVSATDYLMKPIDIERLKEAVQKVVEKRSLLEYAKKRLDLLHETLETNEIKALL